jgi:hypothetical protein
LKSDYPTDRITAGYGAKTCLPLIPTKTQLLALIVRSNAPDPFTQPIVNNCDSFPDNEITHLMTHKDWTIALTTMGILAPAALLCLLT